MHVMVFRERVLRALLGIGLCIVAVVWATQAPAQSADGVSVPADSATISLSHDGRQDGRIRARIEEIFGALGGLENVQVSVDEGVVILSGEVDAAADETRALALARQVEGVVETVNHLDVDQRLGARTLATWRQLAALVERGIGASPLILAALVVVLVFWLFARWVGRQQPFFRRVVRNPFVATLVAQFMQLAIGVLGCVLALVLLDATALIGTLLGAAGIVGLALGFAVRDTVENYIASLLLSLRNPFEMNDLVTIEGHEGTVARLTTRATILISPDGNHIRIPNATVFKAVITNYTRHPERRFSFSLGVDTDLDLLEAQVVAMQTLQELTGVLDDPAPMVVVDAIGDSNVVLTVYGWVNQLQFNFAKVRSEAIRAVKQAFDAAGIVMPEPIYKLRLVNTDAVGPRSAELPSTQAGDAAPARGHPPETVNEVQDLRADHAMAARVEADARLSDEENLLDPAAPKEL